MAGNSIVHNVETKVTRDGMERRHEVAVWKIMWDANGWSDADEQVTFTEREVPVGILHIYDDGRVVMEFHNAG